MEGIEEESTTLLERNAKKFQGIGNRFQLRKPTRRTVYTSIGIAASLAIIVIIYFVFHNGSSSDDGDYSYDDDGVTLVTSSFDYTSSWSELMCDLFDDDATIPYTECGAHDNQQ
jgi:hypothetical protein